MGTNMSHWAPGNPLTKTSDNTHNHHTPHNIKDYSGPSDYRYDTNSHLDAFGITGRGLAAPHTNTSDPSLAPIHSIHHKPTFNYPSTIGNSNLNDPILSRDVLNRGEVHSYLHGGARNGASADVHHSHPHPHNKLHTGHQGLLGGHAQVDERHSLYEGHHSETKPYGAVKLMGIEGQRKPDGLLLNSSRKNVSNYGHTSGGYIHSGEHIPEMEEEVGAKTLPVLKDKHIKEDHSHESHGVKMMHSNESKAFKPLAMKITGTHIFLEPKGLVGLKNIGNTCFMNSILQCLFNAPAFSDYFVKGAYSKEINKKNDKGLAKSFAELLGQIRSHSGSPSSSAENTYLLKRRVEESNPMFEGYAQHDAQEFLKALLEGIHDDVNRVKKKPAYKELKADTKVPLQVTSTAWSNYMLGRDNSIVTDLFGGQLLNRTICTHCGHESLAFDNYWDLSLSFTGRLSTLDRCDLPSMIEHFLKEETLDDLMNCEKCKQKRKFKKCFSFWRLPNILAIHLKRFHYEKYRKEKITHSVRFPVKNLDLSEFVKDSKDISVADAKYSLFGIVNHSGNLNGGHYTAECKNPHNKMWYNYNDSSVKESHIISEKDTESEGENPYILFYIKTSCI
jgi:ubiquitin C-terminal hydrolase